MNEDKEIEPATSGYFQVLSDAVDLEHMHRYRNNAWKQWRETWKLFDERKRQKADEATGG